jgi:hypothetical protein
VEPLTPELALVDPELARLARDRLPPSGETLSSPRRATPSHNDHGKTRAGHPWISNVDDARRTGQPLRASSSLGAEAQSRVDAAEKHPKRHAPSRVRRRGRVIFGALAVALGVIAVYALAPDSTVPERATHLPPNTAPTRIDHHRKTLESTRPGAKTAGAGTQQVPRHSEVLGASTQKRAKSTRPRPFPSRVFIWPPVLRATLYKVEFFRRGREVFKALSSTARLELPERWVYDGRTYRLVAGVYSWKVSPAFGPRSRLRYGNPIVRSTWVAQR